VWLEKIGLQSLSPIFQGNFTDIFHSKILIQFTSESTPLPPEKKIIKIISAVNGVKLYVPNE
jgi:hypothetical protein